MMGPLYRFRDTEHLKQLLDAIHQSGITISKRDPTNILDAYWFRKGLGKVHGSIGTEEWESVIYLAYGHTFNPLCWFFDAVLLKKIETIFLSTNSERIHFPTVEIEAAKNKE